MTKKWAISGSGENFWGEFPDLLSALQEAAFDYDLFYVGQARDPWPPNEAWTVDGWLEEVFISEDYSSDYADSWGRMIPKDSEKELTSAVHKTIGDWLDRHNLWPEFFVVDGSVEYAAWDAWDATDAATEHYPTESVT